jgi:Skp family chaperone for outer membrane proteins
MTVQGQEPNEEGKKPEAELLKDKGNPENTRKPAGNMFRNCGKKLQSNRTEAKETSRALKKNGTKKQKEADEKRLESQKEFETLANERKDGTRKSERNDYHIQGRTRGTNGRTAIIV